MTLEEVLQKDFLDTCYEISKYRYNQYYSTCNYNDELKASCSIALYLKSVLTKMNLEVPTSFNPYCGNGPQEIDNEYLNWWY